MKDPVDRAIRAIARRNSYALVWAPFGITHLVTLAGLGLLRLYQPMSLVHFLTLIGVSQALVAIDNVASIKLTRMLWRPVRAWERTPAAERTPELTIAAWRALVTLPKEYVRRVRGYPFTLAYLPFIAFTTWLLGLRWYSFFIIAAAGTAVVAYGLIARYFAMEVVTRPVLEPVAAALPPGFRIDVGGLPLRWRLLAVAPIINVITGVVVASLSSQGRHVDLANLGFSWLVAVAVSFTISLELVVLVARSLAASIADLQSATERVMAGDLGARVPVVTIDETGRLALDVRDFTAFAEAARPREVVALLNGLWELAVPVLLRHGGHANKFIGDGLLGVFGAPEPLPDHGERAVAAAVEIAGRVGTEFAGRVSVGIGVNSGPVIAGTVGGGGRVEYAVIGDTVNTASRVEATTRQTGDPVLITEATRALLPRTCSIEMVERSGVELRGKQAPVRLWAPVVASVSGGRPRARGEPVAD
ncbi:MAG: adenylate/guanylate cyclase domain-containing protein [Solirubrobacteraceae bacterium]